jgi:hypothetical protein
MKLLEGQVVEQADEDFFEPPGHFADAHHGQIERREDPGMTRQRQGQLAAGVQAFAHVLQDVPHCRIGARFLQTRQRAHDRYAGTQQGMNLPRKQQHVHVLDFLLEQVDVATGAGFGLVRGGRGRLDFQRRHAGAKKQVGDRPGGRAFHGSPHDLSGTVATAIGEPGHAIRRAAC